MHKKILLALVPIVTAVGPLLFFSAPNWWPKLTAALPTASLAGPSSSSPAVPPDTGRAAKESSGKVPGKAPLLLDPPPSVPEVGVPLVDMAEAFRFDLTIGAIIRRWPRVSAGLAEIQLQGYRVPLVTGTAEDDLTGSLTYYFSPRQQLQRITFQGTTGNPKKLVEFLVSHYRLGRSMTPDARLFRYELVERTGAAKSYIEVRPVEVVRASEPYHRFQVAMVLERPSQP